MSEEIVDVRKGHWSIPYPRQKKDPTHRLENNVLVCVRPRKKITSRKKLRAKHARYRRTGGHLSLKAWLKSPLGSQ